MSSKHKPGRGQDAGRGEGESCEDLTCIPQPPPGSPTSFTAPCSGGFFNQIVNMTLDPLNKAI